MRRFLAFAFLFMAGCTSAPASIPATAVPVAIPASQVAISTATAAAQSPTPSVDPATAPTLVTTATPTLVRGPVIVISIDGLRPDGLLQADAPNIMALAARGAYSFSAQATFPPATLPSHTSMLTGYTTERHGVTWNYDDVSLTPLTPPIFGVVHQAGLRTVMVVGKEKMRLYALPGTIDLYDYAVSGDRDVVDHALAAMTQGFDLMFIHLPNVDFFGHSTGWMSAIYIDEISKTDGQVGRILEAMPFNTTIIISADHGGTEFSHGANIPEHMTIPWIMAGPNTPPIGALSQPIITTDTAATALFALGLSLPPDAHGRPIYEAFGLAPPDISQGTWRPAGPQSPARSEMPAVELNGLIYLPGGLGGETSFQAYHPADGTWADLAPLPEGRHHLMAAAVNGLIYAIGGATVDWAPTDTLFVYDPTTNTWSQLAPLPETRMSGAAVAFNGKIYVFGGVGGTQSLLEYDPALNQWQVLSAMRQPREHFSAVVIDGDIYALGGRWNGTGELLSVEVYTPATQTWRAGPDMLRPHSGFAAAAFAGRILAAGGEIIMNGNETIGQAELFDPRTGKWTWMPDLLVPLHGVPAVTIDNRLYLLGGSSRAAAAENFGTVFVYEPGP
jgi:Type I phosphodiesterase / nucleotide pyrophosphatase/Metalloenzyme superfamily/Kelch motif